MFDEDDGDDGRFLPVHPEVVERNQEMVDHYHAALPGSAGAQYLTDRGLGFSDQEHFKLGYVSEKNALPGHEYLQDSILIPYLIPGVGPVGTKFRRLNPGSGPKYMNLPGNPARVFNVGAMHGDDRVIHATEGEIDCMILDRKLQVPAIGFPGATQFQYRHKKLLEGYSKIILWADADEAGREFANLLGRRLFRTKVVYLPPGEDVNSVFLKEGVEGLNDLLKEHLF